MLPVTSPLHKAEVGFEPTRKIGFADRRLKPLGYPAWESRRDLLAQPARDYSTRLTGLEPAIREL